MFAVETVAGFGVYDGRRWIVPPIYGWIGFYHGGFAYAETFDGRQLLVDVTGQQYDLLGIVNTCISADSVKFVSPSNAISLPGSLIASCDDGFHVILLDRKLSPKCVASFPLNCTVDIYYGDYAAFARVSESNGKSVVILDSHRIKVLNRVAYVDPPSDGNGFWAAKKSDDKGRWVYYDPHSNSFRGESFALAQSFSCELGLIQREADSVFQFVDLRMEVVDRLCFEWADIFRYNLAAATKEGLSGYYDRKGDCVIRCEGSLGRFNRLGHAIVGFEEREGQTSIVNREGKILLSGLDLCTFFDGDFPCYHANLDGKAVVLTEQLSIFPRMME